MPRRLFLFAAFDRDGVAGPSLILYLRALSSCGDVVLASDCSFGEEDRARLDDFCLHTDCAAHHEYDFGSYKRAWIWAAENLDLPEYDYVYLVNDSVFGPLMELGPYLELMEGLGRSAFALAVHPHGHAPHLQSWFIGLGREVYGSPWFDVFLRSVRVEESKEAVCERYENGLTGLLDARGVAYGALFRLSGKSVYNAPARLFRAGFPFVKKSSFTRHCGCLGAALKYVLDHVPQDCRRAVVEDASRLYGRQYVERLLVASPLVMAARYLKYLSGKLHRRSA